MMNKKIPILLISRSQIQVYLASTGKNPSAQKITESAWTTSELPKLISQLKIHFKNKNIRILLDDNISYSLCLPITNQSKNERQFLSQQISSQIPEKLNDFDWDFTNVSLESPNSKKSEQTYAFVFAPEKSIWASLKKTINQAKLNIEAVEPVIWAKKRHSNPVIGLALKTDLEGPDEQVLNLSLENKSSKNTPGSKGILIIILSTIILGSLIAGGILISRSALQNAPKPLPSLIPEINLPSPSPSPQVDIKTAKIQLIALPGSNSPSDISKILKSEGFKNIESTSVEKDDLPNSQAITVSSKPGLPDNIFDAIDKALSSSYPLSSTEKLSKDNEYDMVIVIGRGL